LGATETTWGEALGVGATILVTRGTLNLVLEVEDGLLTDSLNLDWPGLVLARGSTSHGQDADDHQQNGDGHEGITVSLVKLEHLL